MRNPRRSQCYSLLLAGLATTVMMAASIPVGALPRTSLVPNAPGDEKSRSTPFITWIEDLSNAGYREEEYLVSDTANVYGYESDEERRPEVTVIRPDVPYTTRMLVRRPIDAGRFSGTVYVEVLNASAGWDGDPIWQSTFEYLIREGAVWVGVSTKPVTVSFLRDKWGRAPWPTRNARRYETLAMPEFGQVWDMLTQVGRLLKERPSPQGPLADLDVRRLIMVGFSQSAAYQITYANSFHRNARMPNGTSIYDGYFVSAGGASAKHVTGATDATENLPPEDPRNLIKVDAPVIRFQTQTEVVDLGAYRARQSEKDYPQLRFYEMAGGSHVDSHIDRVGGQALQRDLGLPPSFCASPAIPYNPINIGHVQAALMEALENWIIRDKTPPASRFLQLTEEGGMTVLARDSDGNALAGVRPPQLQVPLGRYTGSNSGPGFCRLYGGFEPFRPEKLETLYPTRSAYVDQYTRAVSRQISEGFLLEDDAAKLLKAASETSIGAH